MKGIYLCAFYANHPQANLDYQDRFIERDIGGDCLDVNLDKYDYIIATPPCNYWSKANYRRNTSFYALSTMHLLPCLIIRLRNIGKPFIIENVRNDPMFEKYGVYENAKGLYIYRFGRHTYFTNIELDLSEVSQIDDSIKYISHRRREGGENVKRVIDKFIETIGGFSHDQ